MFDDIQPGAEGTDTTEAARNTVEKRQREVERDAELNRDARITELMKHCEVALTGNKRGEIKAAEQAAQTETRADEDTELWGQKDPDALLIELGALLEAHDDVQHIVRSMELSQRTAVLWNTIRDRRHRGEHVKDLTQELAVYASVAEQAGLIGSYVDRSKYAPVRLESLDIPGQRSLVEDGEQTPVARLRVGASEAVELEDRVVTLPLKDCRHILAIADPRQGKDSTIARLAGCLKDEHQYKWVSLHDDGREECRMIEIPADDPGIQQSLKEFGQTPKGYKTTVYLPATDLPDELPTNHEPFSVGVDSLTPDILARLSGIKPGGQTSQRVSAALEEVQNGSGKVDVLIDKLRLFAEETTAEITVERPEDEPENASDMEFDEYEMSADTMLRDIVESLTIAAGQGIIRDRGANTNIDMEEVIADQSRVAALNANHLDDSLKHLSMLVWMDLLWQARDANPDLPRVALTVREMKNLAPASLGDSKFTDIAQGLRQMFYLYSSQGSARRIMLLGSTQKIRDVYKSIRSNMDIKIVLKLQKEKVNEIQTGIPVELRNSVPTMQQGWGAICGGGESDNRANSVWPVNFCGARCGLGLGDVSWRDRYGVAAGWRVADGSENLDEWVDGYGDRVDREENDEELDDGDWYLAPRDMRGHETVGDALQDRMRDGMPEIVKLHDPSRGVEEIDMQLVKPSEEDGGAADMDIPPGLEQWVEHEEKVERWVRMLEVIEDDETTVTSYGDVAELSGTTTSTVSNDMKRPVGACMEKEEGQYTLTSLGVRALNTDWTPLTRA